MLADSVLRMIINISGWSLANQGLNEAIIQSLSNVIGGIVSIIVTFFMAPRSKMTAALVVSIILFVVYCIVTVLFFAALAENPGRETPLWVDCLVLFSNMIGIILGYVFVRSINKHHYGL